VDFKKIGLADIEYQYFGSYSNGFGTTGSDVDLTILTNSFVNEREVLKYIFYQIKEIEGIFLLI
jgi:predicted nucleotidyltransferase